MDVGSRPVPYYLRIDGLTQGVLMPGVTEQIPEPLLAAAEAARAWFAHALVRPDEEPA